jgi:hypothetical protein
MKGTAKESSGTKKSTTSRTPTKRVTRPRGATQPAQWPTEHEIRLRAYLIYERRGGTHGQALTDWLQAEQELLAEYGH